MRLLGGRPGARILPQSPAVAAGAPVQGELVAKLTERQLACAFTIPPSRQAAFLSARRPSVVAFTQGGASRSVVRFAHYLPGVESSDRNQPCKSAMHWHHRVATRRRRRSVPLAFDGNIIAQKMAKCNRQWQFSLLLRELPCIRPPVCRNEAADTLLTVEWPSILPSLRSTAPIAFARRSRLINEVGSDRIEAK